MQITDRIYKGGVSLLIICACLSAGIFFNEVYPTFKNSITIINLPKVSGDFFLLVSLFVTIYLLINWSIRNQIWKGIKFSIEHYLIIKNIRKHLLQASFQDSYLKRHYITLPKIKIEFDNKKVKNTGKIMIQNSIRFDQKLENLRIDSAIKHYVCERQYLSENRNWYIYEFYSVESFKQFEFKTEHEYLNWTQQTTNDYEIRLDNRSTCPIHHTAISGQTGAGKSFFIQMLIDQVINKDINHEFFIIDPKRADVYEMAIRKFGKEKVADKNNAIDLIKTFHKKMIDRQNELQLFLQANPNKTFQHAELPALILLIDEFGSLRELWNLLPKKERDKINYILSDIAFMGRQSGCLLWVATQQMNAQTIPTAIREQLVLKIVLGDSDEQTYRTLFASSVDVPSIRYAPGIGLYAYPNLASIDKPKLLTLPYCSYLEQTQTS